MRTILRQEREKRGWTQEEVAKRICTTPEAVCLLETGRRKPSYEVLVKLENLFGLTHRELFAAAPDESNIYHKNNSLLRKSQ